MEMIGWREWVSFPELKIPSIKAKVDTGARTSTLHAYFVEEFIRNDQLYVRFGLHPIQSRSDISVIREARVKDRRDVTDSGGHRESRYVIETIIAFSGAVWPIEVTLTNRENMKFRMLLGRTAMKGRFTVNPSVSFLGGRSLARAYDDQGGRK
ncbi:MAG: ATP-dependent zinc protease [Desulfuromonas sp.]|nr:MAG: ATP-dependent zinc protease [Desulfuromonas sp.]